MGTPTKYSIKAGCLSFVSNYIEESIPFKNIRYLQSKGKVCHLYVKNLDAFKTYVPLAKLYKQLPKSMFVKINRSCVISLKEIRFIEKDYVQLCDGSILPITKSNLENVSKCYKAYMSALNTRFCKDDTNNWQREFLKRLLKNDEVKMEVSLALKDNILSVGAIDCEIERYELASDKQRIYFYPNIGGCVEFNTSKVVEVLMYDDTFIIESPYQVMTVRLIQNI